MLAWTETLAPALQERLVLWLNHVMSREPEAMARLKDFDGRRLRVAVQGAPAWAPPLPDLLVAITPAGLFERLDPQADGPEPALSIDLDASNPLLAAFSALQGKREGVRVSGDVGLAGAVNWLMANLRWDPVDDVATFVGPAPAQFLAEAAEGLKAALAQMRPPR